MKTIVFFALLVSVSADVSHLELNSERHYLPPERSEHINHKLKSPDDATPYVFSRPRAIPDPPNVVIPTSNLHTYVADLPLTQRLFTAAGSDPVQQAGSDHVVYAAAPNSVFHTQINVQSQGSEFNAPGIVPIEVDTEEDRLARIGSSRGGYDHNNRYYEHISEDPSRKLISKHEHSYDQQRLHQQSRSHYPTKSSANYRQDHVHKTEDHRSYHNEEKGFDAYDGRKGYDNHDHRHQYDSRYYGDYHERKSDGNHNTRYHDNRKHYDSPDGKEGRNTDHRNYNDNRKPYNDHDGKKGYRDPDRISHYDDNVARKTYNNHDSVHRSEDHKYDHVDEKSNNDHYRKSHYDDPSYKSDKHEVNHNDKKDYTRNNHHTHEDHSRSHDHSYKTANHHNHDKAQPIRKETDEHAYRNEKRTHDDHNGQRGYAGRNQPQPHTHHKSSNHRRTETVQRKRPNYQGVNLINGNIASDQASLLPQPPQNLNGNTQGINIINGNILGNPVPSGQYKTSTIQQKISHNGHENYRTDHHDHPEEHKARHGQDGNEPHYFGKGSQYVASDRSVISPSAIKIIAFNNNNPPAAQVQLPFSASNAEPEFELSASAPEVIYKSGDEIDFAETKLVDYADNRLPLETYKFVGKKGRQRKAHPARSETDLRDDGYHYSKPSISFSS